MSESGDLDYKPNRIEPYWQKFWEEKGIFSPDIKKPKKPFYNLMMFPYPSAEGLHVGNMYAFTGVDVYGRFVRMRGKTVFEPIGLDGFGIHSENYALKINRHPKEQAKISEQNFYRQLRATGNSFDWTRTLETYDPDYYKWTQWIFVQLFKAGLLYKDKAPVNWCPNCKTVLADEQVIRKLEISSKRTEKPKGGKGQAEYDVCERCGTKVTVKKLNQWFFRIASGHRPDGTPYPDALLNNLSHIDWVKKVKIGQRNWIGRKEGINIHYSIVGTDEEIVCFTTRPDTNFGATFIVLGPEHPFVEKIINKSLIPSIKTHSTNADSSFSDNVSIEEIKDYVEQAKEKTQEDRIAEGAKKTGVFTGFYAVNKLNDKRLPVWISDFVLGDVGTGAVVGVPGHDRRDFQFAKTFGLPIVRVVVGPDGDTSLITREDQVQEEEGTMVNSGFLNGMDIHDAIKEMMDYHEEKGWGKRMVHYHLRDWLISRQRYWGAPIPMIYCKRCASDPTLKMGYKVLVLHGTWGHSKENWFVWLKQTLERRGTSVAVPDLPDSKTPNYDERMAFLEKNFAEFLDEQTVVISHSSGAPTALHLAEKHKLKQIVLVAPVVTVDDFYEKKLADAFDKKTAKALRDLATRNIDLGKVESNVGRITALFGGKDPYIPSHFIKLLKEMFSEARITTYPYKQHFSNSTDGTVIFPELLDHLPPIGQKQNPGWHTVPELDLPVVLPDVKDWKPRGTGKSPLALVPDFVKTTCPYCGGKADRETDVCDTFLDSSWYFLHYPSVKNRSSDISDLSSKRSSKIDERESFPWDPQITKKWLPVDMYIGGAEHTVLHLLYARFITMVLHDLGYLHFEEPFSRFYAHGLIIKDGAKMSKSKGNIVVPDEYIKKYGADALRAYLMFLGPFDQGGDFRDTGIAGMHRFVKRVWGLINDCMGAERKSDHGKEDNTHLHRFMHKTIKRVTKDLEQLRYNTAIAAIMEYVNALRDKPCLIEKVHIKTLLLLLAPFMPHMTEDLWHRFDFAIISKTLKKTSKVSSIHLHPWPTYDPELARQEIVTIVVQVNGKKRDTIDIEWEKSTKRDIVVSLAKQAGNAAKYFNGKTIRKTIFVSGKLVNFVV